MPTQAAVSIEEYLTTDYSPDCDYVVPDICVVLGSTGEQIFRTPPFICVEILSPEDRVSRVLDRMDDYFKFGVRYVWLLDPDKRKAYRCTPEGMSEVQELRTENPALVVPVSALFE